ncbi:MAG: hypothetical protein ABI461_14790 [Polyangiaceae bacterium]
MTTSAARLEALKCPKCGSPVPFGDADVAVCTHCHTDVPLPDTYRALRKATRDDVEARARAENVLAHLDRPSWLVTRILAATFDQPMLGFIFFFGIPVGLITILEALATANAIARHQGLASGDDVPFVWVMLIIIFYVFLFAFVPRALGVYANRRSISRAGILAALAARPPRTPGGPASCRNCGAPLFVEPGKSLVICDYCKTDNAVRIETSIVTEATQKVRHISGTADDAARADCQERSETVRLLFVELRRYLVRTVVLGGLLVVYAIDSERPAVKDDHEAPGFGIAALFALVFAIIFFIFRSGKLGDDDAALRRKGAGLPSWVGPVAPIGFWIVLWILRGFW